MTRARGLAAVILGLAASSAPAAEAPAAPYRRTTAAYVVPAVTLIDQSGAPVDLPSVLTSTAPVVVSFLFTTCPSICPVTTATLLRMREQLGAEGRDMRLVSLTIDPDHDRPAVLDEYARRHGTGDGWRLLTGDPDDVATVLRAFDAYVGSKGDHRPLVLLRAPGRSDWVRIDGLVGASDLTREYRRLRGG